MRRKPRAYRVGDRRACAAGFVPDGFAVPCGICRVTRCSTLRGAPSSRNPRTRPGFANLEGGAMVEPRLWHNLVISVALFQAALSTASMLLIAREDWAELAGFDVPGPVQLTLFTFTSVFLPFSA